MKLSLWLSVLISVPLLGSCAEAARIGTYSSAATTSPAPPIVGAQPPVITRGEIPATAVAVKVAFLVPLSGESVGIGSAMLDAASMALYDGYLSTPSDQIKSQIILLPKDTGTTAADSARVAQEAIGQGATFIIGPMFSQSVTQVAPLAKAGHIPMLTFSNNKAVAAENIYTFGFLPEQQVRRMAEYAYLNKFQRVALLAPNDPYGEKVKDTLVEIYAQKGGRVSPGELYAPSSANIDAAVARVVSSYNNSPPERRFQAIFIGDGGYQLKNIIAALKKSNIDLSKIKLLGTGLWDDPDISKIPEMAGAWFPSSPPEMYANFEKHFLAIYGYKPPRLASMAYDAVNLIAGLSMPTPGTGLTPEAITNPDGFLSPANGLVRLKPDGTSERKLDIMEVTPSGFKVIDVATKSFDIIPKR